MAVAIIESLDHEGRGVIVHLMARPSSSRGRCPASGSISCRAVIQLCAGCEPWVLKASAQRVTRAASILGHCGGCSTQHRIRQIAAANGANDARCILAGKMETIYAAGLWRSLGLSQPRPPEVRLVPQRVGSWWGSTSGAAATWPTCSIASCCRPAYPSCCRNFTCSSQVCRFRTVFRKSRSR